MISYKIKKILTTHTVGRSVAKSLFLLVQYLVSSSSRHSSARNPSKKKGFPFT